MKVDPGEPGNSTSLAAWELDEPGCVEIRPLDSRRLIKRGGITFTPEGSGTCTLNLETTTRQRCLYTLLVYSNKRNRLQSENQCF
jgi:hypothetical protein